MRRRWEKEEKEDADKEDEVKIPKRKMKKGKLNSKMAMRDHDSKVILFEDVAGIEQAKIELAEVVDFFLKPEKFKRRELERRRRLVNRSSGIRGKRFLLVPSLVKPALRFLHHCI